ncbi:MAG: hypothetical protein ABIJ09_21965 [Pseudomonadota bacterium]
MRRSTVLLCSGLAWILCSADANAQDAQPAEVVHVDEDGTPTPEAGAESSAAEPAATASAEIDSGPGWQLRFFADEEARVRVAIAPDETDIDGRLYLDASVADPEDHFGGAAALGLWADFDGVNHPANPSGFTEIHEPRSLPAWVDVYSLHARYQSHDMVRQVRAGRLVVQHGLPLTVDGAHVALAPLGPMLEIFAFGGRSVHFFEVSQDLFEDWIASVGVASEPLHGLKLELDYAFHVEDTENEQGLQEHSYGLTGWYRLDDWLGVRGYVRGLDAELSHVGGAVRGRWAEQDLGAELSVQAQTVELGELSEVADPYFTTLGKSLPYLRWRLDLFKGFDTEVGSYALHLGSDGRHVLSDEESRFNRTFNRIYAMATATDIVIHGPFASLTLARHSVDYDFAGDGLWSVSGAAGYADRSLRAEVGSSYDMYKYTYYFSVDEIQDVRTVYAELRYKPWDFLALKARYQYELFAWDIHTVTVGVSQVF